MAPGRGQFLFSGAALAETAPQGDHKRLSRQQGRMFIMAACCFAPQGVAKAIQIFTEPLNCFDMLSVRSTGRKTGVHFSWNGFSQAALSAVRLLRAGLPEKAGATGFRQGFQAVHRR